MKMKQIKRLTLKPSSVVVVMIVISLGLIVGGLLSRARFQQPAARLPRTTYRAGQIPAIGKKLIYLAGPSPTQSQLFRAPQAWDIYWDFLCDETVSPGYFSVTVIDENGSESTQARPIITKGISGFGDQKYTMAVSETVRLAVDSNCHWHLTAKSAN